MKKLQALTVAVLVIALLTACSTKSEDTEVDRIPNTLTSISYFRDSLGLEPSELLAAFNVFNDSIAKIGYPDAGYTLWIIQEDTCEIRFMIQGKWPDQETYNIIHDHEKYEAAYEHIKKSLESLETLEYHRFIKVK